MNQRVADARLAELEATLEVARLPARPDQIASSKAAVALQQAVLENAIWRLEQRSLSFPAPGTVVDIIRHAGEIAGPQSPVLSVLPDGAIKLRLYVPQTSLARISLGTVLQMTCDGCDADLSAQVSYISDHAEFAPPVIYSLEARQKLVFLIEARPIDDAFGLKPGQIVDVMLDEIGQ